jgi:hypothetical protein
LGQESQVSAHFDHASVVLRGLFEARKDASVSKKPKSHDDYLATLSEDKRAATQHRKKMPRRRLGLFDIVFSFSSVSPLNSGLVLACGAPRDWPRNANAGVVDAERRTASRVARRPRRAFAPRDRWQRSTEPRKTSVRRAHQAAWPTAVDKRARLVDVADCTRIAGRVCAAGAGAAAGADAPPAP